MSEGFARDLYEKKSGIIPKKNSRENYKVLERTSEEIAGGIHKKRKKNPNQSIMNFGRNFKILYQRLHY